MFTALEEIYELVIRYCVLILETVGAVIIVVRSVQALLGLIQHREKATTRLTVGIETALTFLLAGEVLKTTIVHDWKELGILGVVMALRIVITLLIHWESKIEETKEKKKA